MHYLYLDASGDLGHYTESPGASKYFVITVLEVTNDKDKKAIEKATERTLKNKLHKRRSRRSNSIAELKATNTTFAVKQYFYRQIEKIPFGLYTVIQEFNKLLRLQIESQLPPQVSLFIDHRNSNAILPLQAVDLFSWGIYRQYETEGY